MKTNKKMKTTIQQGDVLLRRIDAMPAGEVKVKSKKKLVLAEGESTGHYHGIVEPNSKLLQVGDTLVLDLAEDSILTHQEHGHINVEAGLWEVGQVNEYDYLAQMKRKVVD